MLTRLYLYIKHPLFQSSVYISNYNITSLIYKLTTGEEYSPSTTKPFKVSQRSFQDVSAWCGCQEVIHEEVGGQDFRGEGAPELIQGGDCAAGAASRTEGPLFSGEWQEV